MPQGSRRSAGLHSGGSCNTVSASAPGAFFRADGVPSRIDNTQKRGDPPTVRSAPLIGGKTAPPTRNNCSTNQGSLPHAGGTIAVRGGFGGVRGVSYICRRSPGRDLADFFSSYLFWLGVSRVRIVVIACCLCASNGRTLKHYPSQSTLEPFPSRDTLHHHNGEDHWLHHAGREVSGK